MPFIREGRAQAAVDGCYICPMCRHQCTTLKATRQETDSPRSKAFSLLAMQRGLLEWEGSGLVEQMYRCCGCQLCTTWCASGYEPAEMVQAARADLVQELKAPARVMAVLSSLESDGNPLGKPAPHRRDALEGFTPVDPEQAEVLWFVGCSASYEAREEVTATAQLFGDAGVAWTVLPEEGCCGAVAWSLGFRQEAREMAQKVMADIAQTGCQTVVTSCPTCFQILARDVEKWGVQPAPGVRVLHVSQYLHELMSQGRLKLEGSESVTAVYHDPCSLGRQMGIYSEPRELLAAIPGVQLLESRHAEKFGECCGYGGGMGIVNPDIAATAAQQTLEGKLKTGAQLVVTNCPSCQLSLRTAAESMGVAAEVVSLVTLLARSKPGSNDARVSISLSEGVAAE